MKEIILYRIQSQNHLSIGINKGSISIYNFNIDNTLASLKSNGICDIINDKLIAILGYQGKNYVVFKSNLHEISKNSSIKYYCGQSETEKSWFEFYENQTKIFRFEYINPHKPMAFEDDIFADWDKNNIASILSENINKVIDNPSIKLFNKN